MNAPLSLYAKFISQKTISDQFSFQIITRVIIPEKNIFKKYPLGRWMGEWAC